MDAQLQTSPGQSVAATENYDVNKWNEMTPEEQQKVIELRQINGRFPVCDSIWCPGAK